MFRQVLGVILLATLPVLAPASEREAKIAALMEAQGSLEMWQQQLATARDQTARQVDDLTAQFTSEFELGEEQLAEFEAALREFMERLTTPWSAEAIVAKWAEFYGPHFTDEELDRLVAFYTSELGRKEVAASTAALAQFSQYFEQEGAALMEDATVAYMQRLKGITDRCACPRRRTQ